MIGLSTVTMPAMDAGTSAARNDVAKHRQVDSFITTASVCFVHTEAVCYLESAMGLEPTVSSLEDWCASQLRFADKLNKATRG
jgi:hypothetical protein